MCFISIRKCIVDTDVVNDVTCTRQVIFRNMIVLVVDLTFSGAQTLEGYINYEYISYLNFCIMTQSETRISSCTCQYPKIASSGIVLISFIKNDKFMFYCSPLPNVSDKPICLCQDTAKI